MNDKNNKLIALFMGLKPHHQDAGYLIDESKDEGYEAIHESCFLYDSSWDWLMPVVDKCTQIGFRDTDTDDNPLYELWDRLFCDNMGQFVGNHIDEVYNSVVEFIKTYNDER